MVHSLQSHMLAQMQAKPEIKRWWLAYSGGLDSTVLLHVAVWANRQLRTPRPLCAIHINHQLSPQADQWQRHCQRQAQALGIALEVHRVSVELRGQGVEAAARQARYQVFRALLAADDALLTGHHQQDQAETLLLRLLRGAGVLGLGAMAAWRPLGAACLWRPLLNIEQVRLHDYAVEHGLCWVEDHSNQSLDFDRNYLRHRLLPLLSQRWRQAVAQLAKTAERLQASQQLLDDLAALDLQQVHRRQARWGCSIDAERLCGLSRERINNLLRFWCVQAAVALPDSRQLAQIHRQLLAPSCAHTAAVQWGPVSLRRFQQRLYLLSGLPDFSPAASAIPWDIAQPLQLPGGTCLQASMAVVSAQTGIDAAKVKPFRCEIRWRSGTERCRPAGRARTQTLKKLLQEYALETWLRDRIPLLYIDNQLAAVGDLWVCADFAAEPGAQAYFLQWGPA
ncbi:MAG: tRNA lysidine(34) synthetase TilS [Cellvibrionaceae bacterium]|nr:tRNA lysidine(34) synthetase TilS [Cellvibrionaceae bacterium]